MKKRNRSVFGGLLVSLAGLSNVSLAATAEEALQNIDPHVCKRQDAVALPTAAAAARSIAPDLSCAIDVDKAAPSALDAGTVVVDTRPTAEFDRFHINGAINLEAGAVRTRSFLSRRKLILVGNGKGEQQLYAECARLKKNGFADTHVLRGGMVSWTAAQLSVVGTAPAVGELVGLSAAELFEEESSGANRAFVMPAVKNLQNHVSDAVLLKDGDMLNTIAAVKKSLSTPGAARVASVVVATGRALDIGQLSGAVEALSPWPVLFYMEDEKSYVRFLATQKAVWTAQARGPKLPPCAGF
jgi:rhodanese-related sulfurtransferase